MKNAERRNPVYSKCPEEVKRRIENVFSWTLQHYPYPNSIKDRINWIHSMEEALRTIEADSVMLYRLEEKKQNCLPVLRLVR